MSLPRPAALLPVLLVMACAPKVGENTAVATMEPAPSAQTTKPSEALDAPLHEVRGADIVSVDPSRSWVQAIGAKVTNTHAIDFHEWTGTLQVKKGELVGVDVTVQVASLGTELARLTAHLLNEDFLYTEVFPRARFSSTLVEPSAGPNGATHTVTGHLTLHGHTEALRFPVTFTADSAEVRADANLVIDRNTFGIVYPGRADDRILDDVQLNILLVGDAS